MDRAHYRFFAFRKTTLVVIAGLCTIHPESSEAAGPNALSPSEAAAGYESLFNGESLDKWRSYLMTEPASNWEIAKDSGGAFFWTTHRLTDGHLITRDSSYLDFDLKLEWNVPPAGNSGIFIRYLEGMGSWGGLSGPEFQVVDISNRDGIRPLNMAGTCYDMFQVDSVRRYWMNPTGQWNQVRIVAFGRRIAHYGNGMKLLEYEIDSPAWKAAKESSKYRNSPRYGDLHKGSIYLQFRGETMVKFRNIRIRRFSESENPWAEGSVYLNPEGTGLLDKMSLEDDFFAIPVSIARPRKAADKTRVGPTGFLTHGLWSFDLLGRGRAHLDKTTER